MDYKIKYNKYKKKYLNLKNQIAGSSNPIEANVAQEQGELISVILNVENININEYFQVRITDDILNSITNHVDTNPNDPHYVQVFFEDNRIVEGSCEDNGIEDGARLNVIIEDINDQNRIAYLTQKYGQPLNQESWYQAIKRNKVVDYKYFNNIPGIDTTTIDGWAIAFSDLTQVNIPKSVTTIGDGAFVGNKLTQVTIPNTVTIIGDDAFADNNLTQVIIPNSVIKIGQRAFLNNQLTQVIFQYRRSDITIDEWAFVGNKLTQVTLLNHASKIDNDAFDSGVEIIKPHLLPFTVE